MKVPYLEDADLRFLARCSEAQLAGLARLLTHNEKGKRRLSSSLLHNELFMAMEGHPQRHQHSWRLIAGELQHFGGDSIANKLRGHGKLYREILRDVARRLSLKVDKTQSTREIEHALLEHFIQQSWQKMTDAQKGRFLEAVEYKANALKTLLPQLIQSPKLEHGVSRLVEDRLNRILRTHAAMSVIGHGTMRGAGLGGPVGAAVNSVKAISGSAYRVTIPAVLRIACLRRIIENRPLSPH